MGKEYTIIVYSFFLVNNNKICYNKKENINKKRN